MVGWRLVLVEDAANDILVIPLGQYFGRIRELEAPPSERNVWILSNDYNLRFLATSFKRSKYLDSALNLVETAFCCIAVDREGWQGHI